MTWLQLQDQIRSMTAEEKLQTVYFIEDRDGGAAMPVRFERAEIGGTYPEHRSGEAIILAFTIQPGQPYLG